MNIEYIYIYRERERKTKIQKKIYIYINTYIYIYIHKWMSEDVYATSSRRQETRDKRQETRLIENAHVSHRPAYGWRGKYIRNRQ